MNQNLKDNVYGLGTQAEVDYIKARGGMNEDERRIFQMLHEGQDELFIQEELSMSRKRYKRIEHGVRTKFALGVIACINECMARA